MLKRNRKRITRRGAAGRTGGAAMSAGAVQVWDVGTDAVTEVTVTEAAAGMIRYARSLGPGTPACGEVERQALELLRKP